MQSNGAVDGAEGPSAEDHLNSKGNGRWHSDWFNSCYTPNTSAIENWETKYNPLAQIMPDYLVYPVITVFSGQIRSRRAEKIEQTPKPLLQIMSRGAPCVNSPTG